MLWLAARMGMKVMADIPELVPSFPDKVITMRRSYLEKDRDHAKKYLQALAEAVGQVSGHPEFGRRNPTQTVGHQRQQMIEENLNIYSTAFSFPPRVGPVPV